MIISIIAAVAKNNVIGNKGNIPWHLVPDLVRLKNLTSGHIAILGMTTYLSMEGYYDKSGREMPGRLYLVLTKDRNFKPKRKNTKAVYSVEAAVKAAEKEGDGEIFVIGGKSVFLSFLPRTDKIYLTKIDKEFEGDTFFPDIKESEWKITEKERNYSEKENLTYEFLTLVRKSV